MTMRNRCRVCRVLCFSHPDGGTLPPRQGYRERERESLGNSRMDQTAFRTLDELSNFLIAAHMTLVVHLFGILSIGLGCTGTSRPAVRPPGYVHPSERWRELLASMRSGEKVNE